MSMDENTIGSFEHATLGEWDSHTLLGSSTLVELSGFPGFSVSQAGDIVNRKGKLLRQRRDAGKNAGMRVWIRGRLRNVDRLVLSTFTGHPPCEGYFVRHLNGDRSDNRLENLVWAGSGVNMRGLS